MTSIEQGQLEQFVGNQGLCRLADTEQRHDASALGNEIEQNRLQTRKLGKHP